MRNLFKFLRCVVFGIFIVCNAAITSLAVWNYSLPQPVRRNSQLRTDIYLAFVGCLGLVLVFPIIFIELARKDLVTGRIWFECLWVCLFWLLYLAAAAVVTAIAPTTLCKVTDDECTSLQGLIALSWIAATTLLLYLLLIIVLSLLHSKHDPSIWHSYIRRPPWSASRQPLSSAPTSPIRSDFLKQSPTVVAPRPKRAVPAAIYAYRSGLGPEYEIEHYHPPSPVRPEPALTVAPPPSHPEDSRQVTNNPVPSLYPQYLNSTVTTPSTSHDGQHMSSPPSPPPLRDWPRPNVVMEPLRKKKKKPDLVLNLPNASASGEFFARHPSDV